MLSPLTSEENGHERHFDRNRLQYDSGFSVKKRGMVNEKIPAYGCSFWELLLFGLSPISG